MAQKALDDAYENGGFIPGAEAFPPRWEAEALAFRNAARGEVDIAYGAHARARFDLFLPEGSPRGLFVFVHGGYWKARAKSDWSHFASGALGNGFAAAMVGYPLAPEVRIAEITAHVRDAVSAAAERSPGPIRLTGHSAGGHLVARMAMPDMLPSGVAERVDRVMPISPVSDLRPLLELSMNAELRLDAEEACAESPVLVRPMPHIAVNVVVGAQERPAFLDQARWLAEAWGARQMILPGRHHFDVIDGLADPESSLSRWLAG
jgi:acetyl esterase/lipase